MSGRPIKLGTTDVSTVIRIVDSADGTPETSVEHSTSGIDLWYRREGAVKVSITEAALASLDAAHADGGIEHIGDGYYRLDLPDAACASGATGVMIGGTVTDMVVIGTYHPLVAYDPQDTTRLGLLALPNAAADAAGGLPISDAGGLDLDAMKSTLDEAAADVANIDGAAMRGTDGAYTGTPPSASTIAAAVEAAILDEGDATALLAAIAAKVEEFLVNEGDATATIAAIATACNSAIVAGTIGSNVTAIKAKTDNLPASPAAVGSQMNLADNAITAAKFDESTAFPIKAADTGSTYIARTGADGDTLETLSDQLDGLATSSGSGGFTLTITVNDGTNNLQNALVRVKEGVTDLRVLTNSSGQAVFSVDAATYNIYITKSGYQFTPTTLAVSADASQTYSMTAVAITPSAENTVTGYHICYDSSANPKAGVTHTLIQLTPGTLSASYDSTPREVTSAVSTGLVQFPGLHLGATYKYTRGDTKKHTTFTVPTDVEDTWEMDSVVGSP